MGTQDRLTAAPIFVVGSPRSGTSILTWCLGQHPNILPTEESDWLGPFALQVAAHHWLGSTRGERSQLSALGIERGEFFVAIGDAIDAAIRGHRQRLEELNWAAAQRNPDQVHAEFAVTRGDTEPKARWADGTPEYSLHICGLHKLFPAAKFIHLLRDPDEVAASLLAFRQENGTPLVATVDEAYAYWERTTRACVLAEQALGPARILRLRHADIVAAPERAMHTVMAFVDESLVDACVAPLARRINSSFADNAAAARKLDVQSPAAQRARELARELLDQPQAAAPSAQAVAEFEADFEKRVLRARELDAHYAAAQRLLERLPPDASSGFWVDMKNRELAQARDFAEEKMRQVAVARSAVTICGAVLALQAAIALICSLLLPTTSDFRAVWLALALVGLLVYAWLRRAGLRKLFTRRSAAVVPRTDSKEAMS